MKSLLMTAGMFLLVCGGEFLHIGSTMAKAAGLPGVPEWLPFVVVAVGAALIVECALRTNPA